MLDNVLVVHSLLTQDLISSTNHLNNLLATRKE